MKLRYRVLEIAIRIGRKAPVAVAAVVLTGISAAGNLSAHASASACASPSFAGYPLFVSRPGGATTVHWDSGGHDVFDLVRGSLNVLVGDCNHDAVVGDCAGGDFRNALNAISPTSDVCMANDTIATARADTRIDPPANGGEFYVLRQVEGCGEDDSYNDGTQIADRDTGIFAANGTCP